MAFSLFGQAGESVGVVDGARPVVLVDDPGLGEERERQVAAAHAEVEHTVGRVVERRAYTTLVGDDAGTLTSVDDTGNHLACANFDVVADEGAVDDPCIT